MDFSGTVTLVAGVAALLVALFGVAWVVGRLFSREAGSAETERTPGPNEGRVSHFPAFGRNIGRPGNGRSHRLQPLRIRELSATERQYFTESWAALQSSFVDDPRGSVASADQLVQELMTRRGYPVRQVDAHGLDLNREHTKVLINYRIAHEIAMELDVANMESLREAFMCFRKLFDDLVQIEEPIAQPGV